MEAFEEIKSLLEKIVAQEHTLERKLKEIRKLKIKIAYILGGGELEDDM